MAMGCLHWPPQRQGEQQLLKARQLFASGDYSSALEINRSVLAQFPSRLADQSLFQIGLIYAHPDNPDRDYQKSFESFQHIVDQYPASRSRQDAEMWMVVIGHLSAQERQIQVLKQRSAPLEKKVKTQKRKINQLQDQLEKLKRIDIKMEEKKREVIPQAEEIEEKGNGKDSGS
jgi:hypothetical protein